MTTIEDLEKLEKAIRNGKRSRKELLRAGFSSCLIEQHWFIILRKIDRERKKSEGSATPVIL